MSSESKNKLKELLDRLQVESWQLELLVSGFAIFLTAATFEPISNYASRLQVISEGIDSQFGALTLFSSILYGSVFFVFINLILHLVFRGMWISAIGLRSISGEIDFEELKFAKPFDKFMQKKLGSFDGFIQRLEDISSVIFAFTFLIVFMIISLFLFILFMGLYTQLLNPIMNNDPSKVVQFICMAVAIFILFCGLLYFLDFVSLGFFKKKRWIAIWYYPIYRVFSIITFSWLYRPLYYNLIDNRFGRRVGLFLVPYFIVIVFMFTVDTSINLYIPEIKGDYELKDRYFEDTRDEDSRMRSISIPSKYIKNGFLELFIKYNARRDDELIKEICPSLTPDEESGLGTDLVWGGSSSSKEKRKHSPPDSLLDCVSQLYQVYINDSLYQDLDYYFYVDDAYGEEGLKTIIDLDHIPRGKHILKVNRRKFPKATDSIYYRKLVATPIWLE